VTKALTTSVELCAIYWHFLLFVWLLMFAMLIGGPMVRRHLPASARKGMRHDGGACHTDTTTEPTLRSSLRHGR
jgi:hypothetical protein